MQELKLTVVIQVDDMDENAAQAKRILTTSNHHDSALFVGESEFVVTDISLD